MFVVGLRVGTEAVVKAFFDDSVDLSTEGNGGILKRVLRKGDNRKGYPLVKDRVEIAWKIYLTNGTLVHDSKAALQGKKSLKRTTMKK